MHAEYREILDLCLFSSKSLGFAFDSLEIGLCFCYAFFTSVTKQEYRKEE